VRTDQRLQLESAAGQTALAREREDLFLAWGDADVGPGTAAPTCEEIEQDFLSLGYTVVAVPEMENSVLTLRAQIPEPTRRADNMDTLKWRRRRGPVRADAQVIHLQC